MIDKKERSKLNWRNALGVLAIGLGTISFTDASAIAAPTPDSFKLAQVGVRSRINPPTPLNIRPRTHISSPADNYHYRYPSYNHRRYNRGYGHHHHHSHTHKKRHRDRETVIIINPSNYSNYSNYDGYIRRVIRKSL